MDKYIFDIGRARYKISSDALCALMEGRGGEEGRPGAAVAQQRVAGDGEGEFEEVMRLYREYARTGSLDALVGLKSRLEEVSARYRSMALAEEVLAINSCLPYERRVP